MLLVTYKKESLNGLFTDSFVTYDIEFVSCAASLQVHQTIADLLSVIGIGTMLTVKMFVTDRIRCRLYLRIDHLCQGSHAGYFLNNDGIMNGLRGILL